MGKKYTTLDREIIKAKKDLIPLIIVEGHDDSKFYEKILLEICEDGEMIARIRSVDIFGEGNGCDKIEHHFKKIQDWISDDLEKYIVGIIDRDSFYYTENEEKIMVRDSLKCLLVLKYYSYESYFLTEKVIRKLINKLTNYELTKNNYVIIEFFMNNLINNTLNDLYYVGLECLRNGLETDCNSVFCYGDKESKIGDFNKRRHMISNKIDKQRLEDIANNKNINNSLSDIKKIVKGKHLLYSCACQIMYILKGIEKNCNNKNCDLECSYSQDCQKERCKWKMGADYTEEQIYDMMKQELDIEEVSDIIEAFKKLDIRLKSQYIN